MSEANPFDALVASENGSAPEAQGASNNVADIQNGSGSDQNMQQSSSPKSDNPFNDLVVSERQQKSSAAQQATTSRVDTDPTMAAVASLGRGAASGLKGAVGPLYDTAAMPLNALGARIKPFAQQIDEASPWPKEAASAPERMVNKATETTGAMLPMMATGAAMAQSARPLVSGIGSALADGSMPLLASGTTSGAAQQGAKEAGVGPLGQMAAGAAGGVLPLTSAEGAGRFLMDEGTTAGNRAASNVSEQAAATARPTWPQMRDIAGRTFEKADERGGLFTPEETNQFVVNASRVPPQTPAGKLLEGETPVTKYVDNLQTLSDGPLSYAEVDEIDKGLTAKIQAERDPKTGFLSPQGQQWVQIQDKLRGITNDPGVVGAEGNEGFGLRKQAQGMWAQQARMQEVQQAFSRGASRQVPITGISNEFNAIKQNPARYNQYTPEEQKLIDQLSSNSLTADIARTAGSRILNYLAIGHGNPVGMVASQVGTRMARDFGSSLKENTLNQLKDQILSRQELPELIDKEPLEPPGGLRNGRLLSPPQGETPPTNTDYNPGQRLLPAPSPLDGPNPRQLTYQPRPDFTAGSNIVSNKPNPQTGSEFSMGEAEGMPMNKNAPLKVTIQRPPSWNTTNGGDSYTEDMREAAENKRVKNALSGNARGGPINYAKGGAVWAKPKSYPALKGRSA